LEKAYELRNNPTFISQNLFLDTFRIAKDTSVSSDLGIARFAYFQMDIAKSEAKVFQVIVLASLLLLPAVAVIHFPTTFMNGTVCGLSNKCNVVSTLVCECAVRISGWHAMLFESRAIPADVALKYDPNVAKNIGPGFIQLWEPWAYLAVTVIAVCSAIWCITVIF